jgi:16S rRNA processing protein RimM
LSNQGPKKSTLDQSIAESPNQVPSTEDGVGQSRAPENLVVLGVVTKPHGVRGELGVKLFNPDSTFLENAPTVVLRIGADQHAAAIVDYRSSERGYGLLAIDRCQSREQAEALRGAELCVPRENLPEIGEGEFYYADLEGLAVITPNGDRVGSVRQVISYPAADVLLVESPAGLLEVPLREPYLVRVDVAHGIVVVDYVEDIVPQKVKPKGKK